LLIRKVSFKKLLKVESTMLCENPKTNVAAKNSWKSRGKFKNLFLARVIIVLTFDYRLPAPGGGKFYGIAQLKNPP
jgi:hypothetical protein